MRYRRLSGTGDYTFGQGGANFLVNSAECVGQSVRTRLLLLTGEWFLDLSEGTPWMTDILSAQRKNTVPLYDMAIRRRILRTQGVTGIEDYSSHLDTITRQLTVTMSINTVYGQSTQVSVVLPNG